MKHLYKTPLKETHILFILTYFGKDSKQLMMRVCNILLCISCFDLLGIKRLQSVSTKEVTKVGLSW